MSVTTDIIHRSIQYHALGPLPPTSTHAFYSTMPRVDVRYFPFSIGYRILILSVWFPQILSPHSPRPYIEYLHNEHLTLSAISDSFPETWGLYPGFWEPLGSITSRTPDAQMSRQSSSHLLGCGDDTGVDSSGEGPVLNVRQGSVM